MQKTALITGGSKGIGLATAEKFLSNGFKVVTVSRSPGDAESLLEKYGHQLDMRFADLCVKSEIIQLTNQLKSDYDTFDVLVNNAGTFIPGQINSEEDGVFELQMALNLGSAYHITRGVLPLLKTKGAYIFNICSTASITPYINGGSYCISKHALLGFSKVLRQELMKEGISVSAILPGATLTESWDGTELPESRFIKPGNIAEVIWMAWNNRENCVLEEVLVRPVLGDI